MKSIIKFSIFLLCGGIISTSCNKKDSTTPTPAATVYYDQQDQVGRPAINTVFNVAADKDAFNTTTPATMSGLFQAKFQAHLLGLNAAYTTNALGLNATDFTTALATDYLNVSTTGPTKFFTSTTNYFTGRGLADDVIDNELTLIFGGPTGGSNPGLTSDHVDANDKVFSTSFPYEASPF